MKKHLISIFKYLLTFLTIIGFIFIVIYFAIKQWKGSEVVILDPEAEIVEVEHLDKPNTNNLIHGIEKGLEILENIKNL